MEQRQMPESIPESIPEPIPEPVRKFFWDRHIDRALSKLARLFQPTVGPPRFIKLDAASGAVSGMSGFSGNANIHKNIVVWFIVVWLLIVPVCCCYCRIGRLSYIV